MTPMRPDPHEPTPDQSNPEWFREPTSREHWIAAALFLGFGVFFVLLFFVTAGFWFRWVTLGLGLYSVLYALRQARDARRAPR
jgi:hypothetical protein